MMKLEQLNLYVLSLRMPLVLRVFQTSIFWPSYHFCFSNLVSGLCWFAACTSFDSFSRLFCLLHSCCLLMTICFSTEHTAILFLWVLTFYLFDWVHEPNFLFFGWAIGMLRISHLNFFFFDLMLISGLLVYPIGALGVLMSSIWWKEFFSFCYSSCLLATVN